MVSSRKLNTLIVLLCVLVLRPFHRAPTLAYCWGAPDVRKKPSEPWRAVLRAAPDHLQATINLGLLYAARRNYKQAAELLRRANERLPNTFDILYQLGMSVSHLNREELKR